MPISLQARWTRSAISPRLAIRTLSNIAAGLLDDRPAARRIRPAGRPRPGSRVTVPACGAGIVVHGLHRLDDQQGLALGDACRRPRRRAQRPARAPGRRCRPSARSRRRMLAGIAPRGRRSGRGGSGRGMRRRPRRPSSIGAATVIWRATRTRMPSRSISISVRPVSVRSSASSRIRPARRSACPSCPWPSARTILLALRCSRLAASRCAGRAACQRYQPWPRPPARSPGRRSRRSRPCAAGDT